MAIILRNKTTVYGLVTDLDTLQSNINTEATTRAANDGDLTTLTTTAKNNLVAAINSVKAGLDTEVTDRQTAITDEATARGDADAALQGAIDDEVAARELAITTLNTDLTDSIETAVTAEESRAMTAESDLQDQITTNLATFDTHVSGEFTTLKDLVTVINGTSATAGSFKKAIADVVAAAPEALNTLKEIADYIAVNPDANVADAITRHVTEAVDALKGQVTTANDTLEELEVNLNKEIQDREDAIAQEVLDRNDAVQAEANRAIGVEGLLSGLTTTAKNTLVAAINEVKSTAHSELTNAITAEEDARIAAMSAEVTAREAADTVLTDDLAQEVLDRKAGAAVPVLETVAVVAGDKIVLTSAPQQGVSGIMNFATVRYVDSTGVAYDAPVDSIDADDETGKTFVLSLDIVDQWLGKNVQVQYVKADA